MTQDLNPMLKKSVSSIITLSIGFFVILVVLIAIAWVSLSNAATEREMTLSHISTVEKSSRAEWFMASVRDSVWFGTPFEDVVDGLDSMFGDEIEDISVNDLGNTVEVSITSGDQKVSATFALINENDTKRRFEQTDYQKETIRDEGTETKLWLR